MTSRIHSAVLTGLAMLLAPALALPASCTAAVNADPEVGAIAETITVTSAAPLVDVQNVTSSRVMGQELLDVFRRRHDRRRGLRR